MMAVELEFEKGAVGKLHRLSMNKNRLWSKRKFRTVRN
jgi:hypothetical protein